MSGLRGGQRSPPVWLPSGRPYGPAPVLAHRLSSKFVRGVAQVAGWNRRESPRGRRIAFVTRIRRATAYCRRITLLSSAAQEQFAANGATVGLLYAMPTDPNPVAVLD